MVVVGADVHERTHTFVAVDEVGRKLVEKVIEATTVGHHRAVAWARRQFGTELADIARLTEQIDGLARRIGERVRVVAPVLLAMPGCGELTAAKIVGEAAGVARFKSEATFAHSDVAPVPMWSGNTAGRVRRTRSGNRQVNVALHRIVATQIRLDGLGQTYYLHRLAEGDFTTEALRCLKRQSRVVFGHLHTDHNNRPKPCQTAAA